jgi:hypothetical protein
MTVPVSLQRTPKPWNHGTLIPQTPRDLTPWHPDTDTLPTTKQGKTMADTIATTTTTKASKKIKLNPPTPFSGKRNEFVLFMQDIYIYLKVNQHLYDNDDKKIFFILSYLTGGDAAI